MVMVTELVYQRNSQRFEVKAHVALEDFRTGFYYNGIIYNYGDEAVYLESNYAPQPGRRIRLKVHGAHEIFASETYLAEIRWRRPLSDENSDYLYGIAMKYC
jgi:hypothetical protein